MNELVQKISSYNIFNYLFPGAVFAFIAEILTSAELLQDDLLTALFLYYFIGLVISRIGSLIIEPILKWAKFTEFTSYEDFLSASDKDETVAVLSEQNNMYRTLISMVLSLAIFSGYFWLSSKFKIPESISGILLVFLLLLLFLFAYKKQTEYIRKRVQHRLGKDD